MPKSGQVVYELDTGESNPRPKRKVAVVKKHSPAVVGPVPDFLKSSDTPSMVIAASDSTPSSVHETHAVLGVESKKPEIVIPDKSVSFLSGPVATAVVSAAVASVVTAALTGGMSTAISAMRSMVSKPSQAKSKEQDEQKKENKKEKNPLAPVEKRLDKYESDVRHVQEDLVEVDREINKANVLVSAITTAATVNMVQTKVDSYESDIQKAKTAIDKMNHDLEDADGLTDTIANMSILLKVQEKFDKFEADIQQANRTIEDSKQKITWVNMILNQIEKSG
jgi:hypothetical protein